MDGEGMCKYTVIMQTSRKARNKDLNILKKELSNKAWLIYKDGHFIWTGQEWKKVKVKWHDYFEINSMFRTSAHSFFFDLSCA